VKKLVAMAANLKPDAVYPEVDELVETMLTSITPDVRKTPQGRRDLKVASLLNTEPHIELALLKQVAAPTLILSGDHDLIRLDHTVAIYEALPNAELAVFPNSTHVAPYDDPQMFNGTVERFLTTPFKSKNRIADAMASFEKLQTGLAK
jgi:pimeloyl-ACP methyl ester carboxylesterase